ncbi:MAG: hypothetical protein [Phage AS32]|nr:MAG: hypothetical protein [Phage AS32]
MPSVNDNFADAIEVQIATNGGTYTSPSLDTAGNTGEVGEPQIAGWEVSAWWKYTPSSSGNATFDTQLSTPTTTGTDTYVAIHTGTALNNLVQVAADDDSGGSRTSLISNLAVTAGETYWIQVGGFGTQTMNLVLRVTGPASGTGGSGGNANAVPATASAQVIPPTVTGSSQGAEVAAVPATATAQAIPAASISGGTIVEGAGPATATAQVLLPTVTGESGSTGGNANAVPAIATAITLAPAVSAGSDIDAVPATAVAQSNLPAVSTGSDVDAVPATATAAALAPVVTGSSSGGGSDQGFLNAWYSDGVTWTQI